MRQARAAVDAMMGFYDRSTGRWEPERPWWQSGNALQALLDYMLRSGDTEYLWVLDHTVEIQRRVYMDGEFRSDSTDDTAWWALAMVRAYDLTGHGRYLDIARTGAEWIGGYWDATCGGGVWWDVPQRTYKNAISNELYLKLLAALHNRLPGDTSYLELAVETWRWFDASGMLNEDGLVNDGLRHCVNNGGETWTYNQGVILGALVELHRATGDDALLAVARRIATATTTSEYLSPGGILTEPSEKVGADDDAPSFKGIFVRNLDELDRYVAERPYRSYLARQAESLLANASDGAHRYGIHWAGPFDKADTARQASAVDLLTTVL
ncbi:glycoside hydrolase family 76 protein [Micromonospora sp. CPCC 206061]|uniref:glycoside hydrolase family 76 protein n=1 Tax=Micromonospora sp. CPCC 206061 TaxID=3122410 RepID=UPI002FF3A4FE